MKSDDPVRLKKAGREKPRAPRVLESILTTTDFSSESMRGVRYAMSLAHEFNADVLLLHVVPTPPSWSGMDPALSDVSAIAKWAREHLAKIISRELKASTAVRCCVVTGKPFHQIIAAARRSKADLIVMSTRGRTGLRRALIGSTSEYVVRHAGCPVLTVSGRYKHKAFRPKRIMVPIDFSNLSKDALPYARLLAEPYDATIVLVHVVEPATALGIVGAQLANEMTMPVMVDAEQELKRVAKEFRTTTSAKVTVQVSSGQPHDEICRVAQREKSDLVILTTHGFTGFKRMLIGSTAERVVRHASCPVLVVRELKRRMAH